MFVMLYSINWPNFTAWSCLILEILVYMCFPIAYFEINLIFLMLPGQLPPRKIAPPDNPPPPSPHRTIAPKDNCPRRILPRIIVVKIIVPGLLLLDNYSKDNCPLTISPWKLPRRNITFRMICRLHNCFLDKWPREKLPPRKIVPRINYTRYIFFPKNQKF